MPDLTKAKSLQEQKATLANAEPNNTSQKPSHFTTVDEDARRQRELDRSNPLALATQLGGLLATLGFLVWGGWQLMKPPTADELFSTIYQVVDTEGLNDLPRETVKNAESFFTRFPNDPRTQELQPLREQLEFQKQERQARQRSRFAGAAGLKPIDQIYFEALAVAEKDPATAHTQLQALLALYDPLKIIVDFDAAKSYSKHFEQFGDPRLLVIARQRIEQLSKQLQASTNNLLPALEERLAAAKKLQHANPRQAQQMYQAIIKLYKNQAWAREAVQRAEKEMMSSE